MRKLVLIIGAFMLLGLVAKAQNDTFKVLVGNLSNTVTEVDLRNLFSEYSANELIIIKDRQTGRSRGFGYVTFESKEAAEKAIKAFNNYKYKGRVLTVQFAPKEQEQVRNNPRTR